MEKRVIVIVGPTCSGKTSLSIDLAKKLNSEIISSDSRQIYKYLDIGTAKPSPEELQMIRHHFIDKLEPDNEFNASQFEETSLRIISQLHKKNIIPVVAGGSGLYIQALIDGIFNIGKDEEYRKELLELHQKFGHDKLYEILKEKDPETASKMLPQNWKRVMRALEVFHQTGKPIGELHKEYSREDDLEFLQFGLDWNREKLYCNIEKRVDLMLEEGLVDEVKKILEKGYSSEINALNTVGYKEIISYLNGEITFERSVELIKRNTRRFAKRQLTWFRKDKRIEWIKVNSKGDLEEAAERIRRLTN